MRIIGQSNADNVDIAKALMDSSIAFEFRTFTSSSHRVNGEFVVGHDVAHRAQRAIDEVLAKSRYYFAP